MTAPSFAVALKTYRERSGLSQSQLAVEAGFDHSYISRLEAGTRTPRRDCVLTLAERLGLSCLDGDVLLVAAGYAPVDIVGLAVALVLERATS